MYASLLIILIGIIGFSISFYIFRKKHKKQNLVCPMKGHCDTVVNSQFSKFLGIPVEIMGMMYYAVLAISYTLYFIVPVDAQNTLAALLVPMTTGAFMFSAYLTFIQIFAIRQICTWCFTSAGLTTIAFVLALIGLIDVVIPFLEGGRDWILTLHLIGMALGLGAATITDVLFFKFLKDFRFSENEADILGTLSQVIWFALAILIAAGFGLFLPEAVELLQSTKFQGKMLMLLVILINGGLLNLIVTPRLLDISFHHEHKHHPGELVRLRKFAFALGAVSFTSWYGIVIVSTLESIPISLWTFVLIYVMALLVAIAGSQILETLIGKRAKQAESK